MTTFLNINIDGQTPSKFIWKHLLFTFLWIVGVLVLLFRIDIVLLNKNNINIDWLEGMMPILILLVVGCVMFTQKWYYSLAFVFYPILAIVWFIPKIILRKGKIYLFLNYLTYIFERLINLKRTLIHFAIFTFSIILLTIISDVLTRQFAICTISYFYILFIIRYLGKSIRPATIFGVSIETFIVEFLKKGKQNESILMTVFLAKNDKEESLEETIKVRNKNLTRLIMINYALETLVSSLNSFRGKRAYVISLLYELFIFLLFSILYFWFVNYELFQISSNNFTIVGAPSWFDFLYYSIKNIAFSGIDTIKPLSWIAKLVEVFSYLVVGILLFIVIVSMIFSLRSEKINENIKLTTALFQDQNRIVREYVLATYGKDIESIVNEVSNITNSIKSLTDIINKLF